MGVDLEPSSGLAHFSESPLGIDGIGKILFARKSRFVPVRAKTANPSRRQSKAGQKQSLAGPDRSIKSLLQVGVRSWVSLGMLEVVEVGHSQEGPPRKVCVQAETR